MIIKAQSIDDKSESANDCVAIQIRDRYARTGGTILGNKGCYTPGAFNFFARNACCISVISSHSHMFSRMKCLMMECNVIFIEFVIFDEILKISLKLRKIVHSRLMLTFIVWYFFRIPTTMLMVSMDMMVPMVRLVIWDTIALIMTSL